MSQRSEGAEPEERALPLVSTNNGARAGDLERAEYGARAMLIARTTRDVRSVPQESAEEKESATFGEST